MDEQVKHHFVHGEVSSAGPLQYGRNGTAMRLLTVKHDAEHGTDYLGAFLIGEDATDGVIRLGKPLVMTYEVNGRGERIIVDYYYEG